MDEHGEAPELPWTGERVVPAVMNPRDGILLDHLSRYQFAQRFVPGKTVLDAASGSGYGCHMLAAAGAVRVVGVEVDEQAVRYARHHYGGPRVHYVVGDVQALPFADGEFDVVVSFETIEHLPDPDAFLRGVRRVLAPRGLFIVSTPNNPTGVISNPFHRREFSADAFASALSNHFSQLDMYGQTPTGTASPDNVRQEGWRHASYLIALCR